MSPKIRKLRVIQLGNYENGHECTGTFGGEMTRKKAWPSWPVFEPDEVLAVKNVLESGQVNYWTGEECKKFESEFAAYMSAGAGVIALANGTVALELALAAYGVGPGDEVVVPARTFIASASCAVVRGATPIVADIDPITQGLSAETIKAVLTEKTRYRRCSSGRDAL